MAVHAFDASGGWLIDGADSTVLLVCDHASNAVPPGIQLGVQAAAMHEHVAWDIGAAQVAETVAGMLDCRAWLGTFSRLVVDCNRTPDHAIPEKSDGIVIPGNVGLSEAERAARLALHHGFHDGLDALLDARPPALVVSVHSFTPALVSAPHPRPWPIAILWNRDERAARLGLAALEAEDLGGPVGANEPYSGKVLNYTMDAHAEARGLPYLGFEIRQDLISDEAGVARWAEVVVRTIGKTVAGLCSAF
jgi:predicted N-formylglutamate amidohydrolase